MSTPERRVVITGCGVVSPLGDCPASFHAALCEGRSALAPVSLFDLGESSTRRGAEIRDLAPGDYLAQGNYRPLDRTAQLATAAAQMTLDAAGWGERSDEVELGLVLGTMFGSVHTISEFDRRALVAGPKYVKPIDFANSVINAAAGQTAIWHQLRGVNSTVTGGPTAALQALAYAADLIRTGRAEALLAGGVEELCFESFFGFSKTGLLCADHECAVPLDARRRGFLLGEGAALFMLEEAGAARQRGATIVAELVGDGNSFDPSRGQDRERATRAVARSLSEALEAADSGPEAIDAASLSASGSVAGDRHEALGFGAAFGERAQSLPVTAVKSMLGEALGASGAYQTLALLESMRAGRLPGIAGLERRDQELPLAAAASASRELEIRRGIVHALGLDGNSCALVIEAR